LRSDWSTLLNRLTFDSCPGLADVLRPLRPEYYWSANETEWATDIMFKSPSALDAIYPSLLHHAIRVSDSASVLRYLGRRDGRGKMPEEVMSDYRRRYEGIRVKHWKGRNSVKMYNKSRRLLRIETTITDTHAFKVFRQNKKLADCSAEACELTLPPVL